MGIYEGHIDRMKVLSARAHLADSPSWVNLSSLAKRAVPHLVGPDSSTAES